MRMRMNSSQDFDDGVWAVIERSRDYCIVPDTDILFEDGLDVGDRVSFFTSGRHRQKLEGIVRFIDGDVSRCEAEAKRLHIDSRKTTSTSSSFHEDRPRKAADKCKEMLISKKKPDAIEVAKKKQKEFNSDHMKLISDSELLDEQTQSQVISSDNEELDNTQPCSSPDKGDSSSNHLLSEKENLLNKLASLMDLDSLRAMIASSTPKPQSSYKTSTPRARKDGLLKSRLFGLETKQSVDLETSESEFTLKRKASSSPLQSEQLDSRHHHKRKRVKSPPSVVGHKVYKRGAEFRRDAMFIHSKDSCNETIEVFENTSIFCSDTVYHYAAASTSATQVARRLIEGVFSEEALTSCSVSGLPPRCKGKAAYQNELEIKPHLCPKGINAIVSRALYWQKKAPLFKEER